MTPEGQDTTRGLDIAVIAVEEPRAAVQAGTAPGTSAAAVLRRLGAL